MATSFSGGRSRSTRGEPPTMELYHLRQRVECTFFLYYIIFFIFEPPGPSPRPRGEHPNNYNTSLRHPNNYNTSLRHPNNNNTSLRHPNNYNTSLRNPNNYNTSLRHPNNYNTSLRQYSIK
jgi:hypothetical protein